MICEICGKETDNHKIHEWYEYEGEKLPLTEIKKMVCDECLDDLSYT